MMTEKKYIICNYARANWGKTETLLEVVNILNSKNKPQYKLIAEKTDTDKDRWCHFNNNNKHVVISTQGDPYSFQREWLEDAAKTEAKVILTACRTKGSTVSAVYDIAKQYNYEIVWFNNFYFENQIFIGTTPAIETRKIEAEKIVEIIDTLLNK